MTSNIYYKVLTLILVFSAFSCGEGNNTNTSETQNEDIADERIQITQAQFDQSKMTLGGFSDQSFPIVVSASGMIDVPPENRAVVSATMGGYIKTTPLLIGNKVKKGDLLVTIENPEFVSMQQDYMEVNEQLTYLKSEYERQISMKAENITSQKSFLKAESDYKTAVAKHTGLEKQLRMLNISPANVRAGNISSVASIYAPITGSITKVNVTKGSYVSPANQILEIVDTDHIHLELSVFEKDIINVKKGQEIDFKIPEASSDGFKAEVHLVGTSIEPNRTIKVHGHLEDDTNHNFLTGMFVHADIIVDTHQAKALPTTSIVVIDDVGYLLVLDKKEGDSYYFKQQEVKVKNTYNGFTEIEVSNEIVANSKILTKGVFNLLGD